MTTYYIDPSGDDSNSGTSAASALRTFEPFDRATGSITLSSGDIVNVSGSILLANSVSIDTDAGTGADSYQFIGSGTSTTLIRTVDDAELGFWGASGVTWDRINLNCNNKPGEILKMEDNGAGTTPRDSVIKNCEVYGGAEGSGAGMIGLGGDTLYGTASDDVTVEDCAFHSSRIDGINTGSIDNVVVRRCSFRDFSADVNTALDCIGMHNAGNSNSIEDCTFIRIQGKSCVSFGGTHGTGGYLIRCTFSDCRFTQALTQVVVIGGSAGTQRSVFIMNSFFEVHEEQGNQGLTGQGGVVVSGGNLDVTFLHNTFINHAVTNVTTDTDITSPCSILVTGGANSAGNRANINLWGNLIITDEPTPGFTNWALYMSTGFGTEDYGDFFGESPWSIGGGGANSLSDYNVWFPDTLAVLQGYHSLLTIAPPGFQSLGRENNSDNTDPECDSDNWLSVSQVRPANTTYYNFAPNFPGASLPTKVTNEWDVDITGFIRPAASDWTPGAVQIQTTGTNTMNHLALDPLFGAQILDTEDNF